MLSNPISIFIFIFVFVFFSPETPSAAVDHHFDVCRHPASCGDNQTIQYPFYIRDRQESFCGYPGFALSCHQNGHPTLSLSGEDFFVRSVSYESNSFRLSDSDDAVLTASGCSRLIRKLSRTLPKERFRLVAGQGQGEICERDAAERNGLAVEWTAGECRSCNKSGGFCGFESSTHFFKCYCPDRPHALHCSPPAPG